MVNRWTVIGGGPCGMGSVGKLLDLGMEVTWVDPEFSYGRMGKYYRNVPSNTTNGDLIEDLSLPLVFDFFADQKKRQNAGQATLIDLDMDKCYRLGIFVEMLEDAMKRLMEQPLLTMVKGFVSTMSTSQRASWTIQTINIEDAKVESHHADAVLYCCGALPKEIPGLEAPYGVALQSFHVPKGLELLIHGLDFMVDPLYCRNILNMNTQELLAMAGNCDVAVDTLNDFSTGVLIKDETWAVVGSSHSAMLVVMNLCEAGARQVVVLHRSDFRYMHDTGKGWIRYQGIGLKGPVGEWTKANALNHPAIKRIRVDDARSVKEQLAELNIKHCVTAVGFERDTSDIRVTMNNHQLQASDFESYDRTTGQIRFPPPQQRPPPHVFNVPTGTTTPADIAAAAATGTAATATGTDIPTSASLSADTAAVGNATAAINEKILNDNKNDKNHDGDDDGNDGNDGNDGTDGMGLLFGSGIAFPQDVIDGDGNREPWVGVGRSIEQVELMVNVFHQRFST